MFVTRLVVAPGAIDLRAVGLQRVSWNTGSTSGASVKRPTGRGQGPGCGGNVTAVADPRSSTSDGWMWTHHPSRTYHFVGGGVCLG